MIDAGEHRQGFPVWGCLDCGTKNDMLRAVCRKCEGHRPCEHYDGERHCGEIPVRMYARGPLCANHAPEAIRKARQE